MGLPEENFQPMKLIFASNNKHKLEELKKYAGDKIEIISLKDAGIDIDIPEPHDSLEENASEKAWTVYRMTGMNCFSEDTGLEIEALSGEPGVKSARYAGEEKSFKNNIDKVLRKLGDEPNRRARFRAVISLVMNGSEQQFEGQCPGQIILEPRGKKGFGYDPIFVPEGSSRTFAEMSLEEKNLYNHRIKAAEKLVAYLQNLKQTSRIENFKQP
jgi:XTP/dITP diphosphohydrolase